MDESSTTIMDYLMSDTCNLGTLLLNGADVDDGECVKLANAIAKNQSVHTLGLAKNLIGKSEMMNTVDPNISKQKFYISNLLL